MGAGGGGLGEMRSSDEPPSADMSAIDVAGDDMEGEVDPEVPGNDAGPADPGPTLTLIVGVRCGSIRRRIRGPDQ